LFISNFNDEADTILNKFKWGDSFYQVNKKLFDLYRECKSSVDVVNTQNIYLKELEDEYNQKKNRKLLEATNTNSSEYNSDEDNNSSLFVNTNHDNSHLESESESESDTQENEENDNEEKGESDTQDNEKDGDDVT